MSASFLKGELKPVASRILTNALVAIIAIAAGLKAWHVSGTSYFFADDFLNFIFVKYMGLSWSYLSHGAQGEFIPFYRAVNLIYYDLFGLSFMPFRLLLIVYQAAVIYILADLARKRGVRLEFLLPSLTLIALSPIFSTAYQWWSAALNVLWEGLACLGSVAIMARPGRLGILRQGAATALYAAGLLFFPKALFVASILLSVRMFTWMREDSRSYGPALLAACKDTWPIFVTGLVYIACVLAGHYASGAPRPGLLVILHYIWHAWNHGFLTGVLGLDRGFFGRVAMANMLVAAVVLLTISRSRDAWIVWLGFFVYFAFALGVTAVNRAVPFGLESAEWPRYYADIIVFFIALAFVAWRPVNNALVARVNPVWLALSVMVTLFGALQLLHSSARVPLIWPIAPAQTKKFMATVETSLARAGPQTRIANTEVPSWILPQWTEPQNQYRYFLMLFSARVPVVAEADANSRFDLNGNLVALPAPPLHN